MIVEKKPVDPLAADVDPKKRVAPVVVDDALADDVGASRITLALMAQFRVNPPGALRGHVQCHRLLTAQWASGFAWALSYFMERLTRRCDLRRTIEMRTVTLAALRRL